MTWNFERIAGPYTGGMGGLAWDGARMLFSVIDEGFIRSFDPDTRALGDYRKYTSRINGIAFAPDGTLFACQDGGRRVIQYLADGTATPTATRLDGGIHNHPSDLAIDRAGRVWFTDPYSRVHGIRPADFSAARACLGAAPRNRRASCVDDQASYVRHRGAARGAAVRR